MKVLDASSKFFSSKSFSATLIKLLISFKSSAVCSPASSISFKKALTSLPFFSPAKPLIGLPSKKAKTVGTDCIFNCWANPWFSSIFIFISLTFPCRFLILSSSIGVNCLHGLHQGAQKSTNTGLSFDFSITFSIKSLLLESSIYKLFLSSITIDFYCCI